MHLILHSDERLPVLSIDLHVVHTIKWQHHHHHSPASTPALPIVHTTSTPHTHTPALTIVHVAISDHSITLTVTDYHQLPSTCCNPLFHQYQLPSTPLTSSDQCPITVLYHSLAPPTTVPQHVMSFPSRPRPLVHILQNQRLEPLLRHTQFCIKTPALVMPFSQPGRCRQPQDDSRGCKFQSLQQAFICT